MKMVEILEAVRLPLGLRGDKIMNREVMQELRNIEINTENELIQALNSALEKITGTAITEWDMESLGHRVDWFPGEGMSGDLISAKVWVNQVIPEIITEFQKIKKAKAA